MTLTRTQVRQFMFLRVPGLGGQHEAVQRDSDGLVDPMYMRVSNGGPGRYVGAVIYSPTGSASELIREAGLVDDNKLLQTGDPWTMTDPYYELHYLLHPFALNECIRRASHILYGEDEVPLTLWPDGDLSDVGVTHWNSGTVSAPTKSTSYKLIGNKRSLVVPASGGNLYAQSDYIGVEPGDNLFHAAIGIVEPDSSGTAYYALVNGSDSDAILYSNTFSSYRDQIIKNQISIPSNCFKVAIRVGATENGVTTVWKGFPSHFVGSPATHVQSWLKEQKNLLGFSYAQYVNSTGPDRYNALERSPQALVWKQDYDLSPLVMASDRYTLQLKNGKRLGNNDYWIHGYRTIAELQEEIVAEADSTDFDEEMFLTAVEYLVCLELGEEYKDQAAEAAKVLDSQRVARPIMKIQPEQGRQFIGLRRR